MARNIKKPVEGRYSLSIPVNLIHELVVTNFYGRWLTKMDLRQYCFVASGLDSGGFQAEVNQV